MEQNNKPSNIYLLSGDPGVGKSHCVSMIINGFGPGKILNGFGSNTIGLIVRDSQVDNHRFAFNLVIKKSNKCVSYNNFATQIKNDNFTHVMDKWYINSKIFETYAVPMINQIAEKIQSMKYTDGAFLFIIDELGKMQSTSELYVDAINNLFNVIESNAGKNFVGIFVVPSDNSEWTGLDELKNKYNLFNMRNETYDEDRRKFINMIESDKK